jgi:hypothetical protein
LLAHRSDQIEAIAVVQEDIDDREIEACLFDGLQGRRGIFGLDNLEPVYA